MTQPAEVTSEEWKCMEWAIQILEISVIVTLQLSKEGSTISEVGSWVEFSRLSYHFSLLNDFTSLNLVPWSENNVGLIR